VADSPENREREIFNAALELATPVERAAFLDRECGVDAALRVRVEELLKASDAAGGFLGDERDPARRGGAGKISPTGAAVSSHESDADAPIQEGPGARIGRYKLLEKIGEGGFGAVYMAEQEEPVRRRVALKIIKLGMDTRAVVARFEAERQALAMMDHPNIAKVLDGGATASGRPYFVMELVRGVSITAYCDEQRLTMRERIELFMQVCHAVQHAHQKGVIHRDLKPSNILVTMHDDRPVPKVIDFGIAKATEQRLTEKTLFTRFQQFVGTPTYMSPEQTGASGLDVDTRSDIYSLGVLLYELLAGRTPFDQQALLQAGLDEIHRTIREQEPPAPSRRVSSLTREEQTTAAQRRRLDATRLSSELRGDLDRIVMKCLEKNRARRYETANGLAMDLSRHLNNEPVLARPDSAGYRAAKFVRRHRGPVLFGTLLVLALASGLIGTLIQAQRADTAARLASEQRDFALRQLSRAEAINDLNAFLLSDAASSGKPFTAGDLLDRAARIVDRDYAETKENRVEILVSIGQQFMNIGEEDGRARTYLAKAYELSRELEDRPVRAMAAAAFGDALAMGGEFERGRELVREALAEIGDDQRFASTRVFCLLRASHIARESGDVTIALESALEAQRRLQDLGQASALRELSVAMEVAESYRMAGKSREAAAAFEDAFAQLSALGRDDTERAGTLLNNWALAIRQLGRPLEAERLFRRAISISGTDAAGQDVSPMLLNNLAWVLLELRQLDEAAALSERAFERGRSAGDEIVVNQSLILRSHVYREQGNLDRAGAMLDELEPRWRATMPQDYIGFAILASHRSAQALAQGDGAAALSEAEKAIALAGASNDPLARPGLLIQRARVGLFLGNLEQARADVEEVIAARNALIVPETPSAAFARAYILLGQILNKQNKSSESRESYAIALRNLETTMGPDHPLTIEARAGASLP
jgi:serine/threonine protein kinase/tetratricopeptide (TPR) repeat protein